MESVAANNNRSWFQDNRNEYLAVKEDFESGVEQLINRIASFDSSISHVSVKDSTYRFYRDTRFSSDKSPYKRHLGAYISAKGKKSLHGGYYIHIEPGNCFVACGAYCLPTRILTSCRNEIMANTDEWLQCVENSEFLKYYGADEHATMEDKQGFGSERLKTRPVGFPSDFKYMRYLKMKDYCCWHRVPDVFFEGEGWLNDAIEMFRAAKPMIDFTNCVIDDYE